MADLHERSDASYRRRSPSPNHNGGQLAFGPDGYLYIGMGDGGTAAIHSTRRRTRCSCGKILRIDVESQFAVHDPSSNPFAGNTVYRPRSGHGARNPWRFSFDRGTGDLFIADVGQNLHEEVNVQTAASGGGENYGWNIMEGLDCYNAATLDAGGLTLPVAEYGHLLLGIAPLPASFVYRGAEFPVLQGVYLYGVNCRGALGM